MVWVGDGGGRGIEAAILGNAGALGQWMLVGMGVKGGIESFERGDIAGGILALGSSLIGASAISGGGYLERHGVRLVDMLEVDVILFVTFFCRFL